MGNVLRIGGARSYNDLKERNWSSLGTKGGLRRCLFLCWTGIVPSIGCIVETKDSWRDDEEWQSTVAGRSAKYSEHV